MYKKHTSDKKQTFKIRIIQDLIMQMIQNFQNDKYRRLPRMRYGIISY